MLAVLLCVDESVPAMQEMLLHIQDENPTECQILLKAVGLSNGKNSNHE